MKCWITTQAEKDALMAELKLEKFATPDQFQLTDEAKQAQLKAVESMHRRFLCHVEKHFSNL